MDKHGHQQCCPTIDDPNMEKEPWLDFSSGYIQRYIHKLPKSGTKVPWKLKQNYLFDRIMLGHGNVDDGAMVFSSPKANSQKNKTAQEASLSAS
jgi:hypothetical protein